MSNSGLARGYAGRFLPKLTPAVREGIRSGYPHLTNKEVGLKFGVSATLVQYIRTGQRGMKPPGEMPPVSTRLPKIRSNGRRAEIELTVQFLKRAVPLMRNTLKARLEIEARNATEIPLDEPVETYLERSKKAAFGHREAGVSADDHQASARGAKTLQGAGQTWSGDGPLLYDRLARDR